MVFQNFVAYILSKSRPIWDWLSLTNLNSLYVTNANLDFTLTDLKLLFADQIEITLRWPIWSYFHPTSLTLTNLNLLLSNLKLKRYNNILESLDHRCINQSVKLFYKSTNIDHPLHSVIPVQCYTYLQPLVEANSAYILLFYVTENFNIKPCAKLPFKALNVNCNKYT